MGNVTVIGKLAKTEKGLHFLESLYIFTDIGMVDSSRDLTYPYPSILLYLY